MLEQRHIDDLIRIAAAGGGFLFDASKRPTDDLVRIAAAGSGTGARISYRGLGNRHVDDLIRIAAAGNECVEFVD
jgi:hypothetical protein